jgi:60 kDa SS-A/Ro ribonucleoprotein
MMRWPSRDGWTHADALRLARPDAPTAAHALLYRWALRGWPGVLELRGAVDADLVERLEAAQALHEMAPGAAARVISVYRLAEAMVPARLLRHLAVWEALLDVMPLSALVRRLGAMTRAGLLAPGGASTATRLVAGRLRDHEAVHGARISPLALLDARAAYTRGAAAGAWVPVPEVVDALDTAFALALENAPATGKRALLAIDASAAMAAPARGLRRLSCREAAAATALATAAAEPECRVVALATGPGPIELAVSPRHRLDAVVVATEGAAPAGAGTDCALPMTVALERGWAVDAFVVLTAHGACGRGRAPAQALRAYRRRTGIAARLAVVAMASGGVGTADPDDAGMLDVVGFRPETPRVIADFASGP